MPSSTQITHALLKEQGQKIVQLSADVSVMANEMQDIKNMLYSDGRTKQKGVVELVYDIDGRVNGIQEREKVYLAKGAVLVGFASAIGSVVMWGINRFLIK